MRSSKSSTSSRKTAYSDVAALASIHMPAPPYLFTFSTPVKLIRPHCIRCSNINFNDISYPRDAVPTAPPPLGIAAPVIAPVTPVSPSPSLQSSTKHNAHQLEYRDKLHAHLEYAHEVMLKLQRAHCLFPCAPRHMKRIVSRRAQPSPMGPTIAPHATQSCGIRPLLVPACCER